MKRYLLSVIGLLMFAQISAQEDVTILKEPNNWGFERINFPLGFAPTIAYDGFEELRFSPGWRDTESDNYFSYMFAIQINDKSNFTKAELQSFLEKYYRGLSSAVGGKEKPVDINAMTVTIQKKWNFRPKVKNYEAEVIFFDTFNDGRKIILNMDLEVRRDKQQNKVNIITLVSTKPKSAAIWSELFAAKEQIIFE